MKRKYILAALALIGLGVVTTMAFTLNEDLTVGSSVYDVQSTYSTGDISKVKIKPYKGLDNMRMKLTIDDPDSGNFNITVMTDVDLSGCSISDSEGKFHSGDSELVDGYLVFNDIPTGTSKLTITITGYTNYKVTNPSNSSLWEDMESVIFTMTDIV